MGKDGLKKRSGIAALKAKEKKNKIKRNLKKEKKSGD